MLFSFPKLLPEPPYFIIYPTSCSLSFSFSVCLKANKKKKIKASKENIKTKNCTKSAS